MEIEYDPAKNERNVRERGLSFERAKEFEFGTALVAKVWRNGEDRAVAVGLLDDRVHVLVYRRVGDRLRVISFRRAKKSEVEAYEKSRRDLESRS